MRESGNHRRHSAALVSPNAVFPVLPDYLNSSPLTDRTELPGGSNAITHHACLTHPGGSRGYLLEANGKRVAYITDTTVDGSYTEFIRGVDVLIHECYFPDELAEWCEKTGHSHTSQVATHWHARDAQTWAICI